MFLRYVAIVLCGCCKNISGCFICCSGCTRMLQASVPNVSSVFQTMLQVSLSGCYICFTHMLQVFYMNVAYVCNGFKYFSDVFASVSYARFKCFIFLRTYVVSVVFGCFKSRSSVASPFFPSAVSPRCLLLAF